MRPAALRARARSLGIRVAEDGGQLRVEGDALTDDLVAEFRGAKAEVIALLRIEATRSMLCPCGSCREPDASQHGPRCYCSSCLDLDPKWEEWRAEAHAEDAAQKDAAPKRWVKPDLGPDDQALLRACERLDRQLAIEAAERAMLRTKECA